MLALLFGFASPDASAGGFSKVEPRLEAGRRVEIRWQGLPGGIEEMELVGRFGGQRFVRLADKLDPASDSLVWTVPNIPAGRAVLAIRARIGGHETTLFESAPFAIEGSQDLRLPELSYHGDEMWTDGSGSSRPVSDLGLAGSRPGASALPSLEVEPEEPPTELDRTGPVLSSENFSSSPRPSAAVIEPSLSRAPLDVPQRK